MLMVDRAEDAHDYFRSGMDDETQKKSPRPTDIDVL